MAKLGFEHVCCGEDGPAAWAIAELWNERWDHALKAHRAGGPGVNPKKIERFYPPGSLGEAFGRYRATNTWKSKAMGTRLQWERGWKRIDPIFGDVDPGTVSFELLDEWYAILLRDVGVQEAFLAMKIWRAIWQKIAKLKKANGTNYCDADKDPSLGIRRKTPKPRSAIWSYDEARILVKCAWRMKYRGLAAALAVAWDTMLSPVDVRGLSLSQLTPDPKGPLFSLARAKTGKSAIGTVSHKTERILAAYIADLQTQLGEKRDSAQEGQPRPVTLHPETPIFHTRGGQPVSRPGLHGQHGGNRGGGVPVKPRPYTKDTLSKDFRAVRDVAFKGDQRKIMDFRRSGAVEATAGRVDPAALAAKMANSIDTNRELQATYQPHTAELVRLSDEARARGRVLLKRERNAGGSA